MPTPSFKALVAEREGVDLADIEEQVIDAATIPFSRAGFTSDNIEDAVDEAKAAGGGAVAIEDEGSNLTNTVSKINFTGAGVTATNAGNDVTVDIPAAAGIDCVSWDMTYSSGRPSLVTIYDSNTQVDANRVRDIAYTYTGDEPTTVVQQDYDTDGTTVLETTTYTLTWVSNELDKVTSVVS